MIRKMLIGAAALLISACQTSGISGQPTADEADGALKSAFLLDAQRNDSSAAREALQQDVAHLKVTAVDKCELQNKATLVCSVYSEFTPAGSDEVHRTFDRISFSRTDGEWVATLSKP
ncbi:Uncharacterised protein [Leminorella richardii]|uniref:Lipoprotein n=1 Tax=Leminorella richardii TaxID=158841 RepID=A0A2X4V196_9GAMM|nr:hypothetical protein [Leminorella richardii]SQI39050.1 Uncharacterised protein [Leminorella richardii]